MHIEWNKVTRFSQIVAIALFVVVYIVGFQVGRKFENKFILGMPINTVKFVCADNKEIDTEFYKNFVYLELESEKTLYLPQTISASGARYANDDESIVFWNKGDTAYITEGDSNVTYKDCVITDSEKTPPQIANPASINCSEVGGNLVIQKRGDGSEYGLCYFDDNRACEEWALLRGDCPLGGVRTIGFDTDDQKFCAWSGGQTFAVPNSICTFKDGSKCSTVDFYNGSCPVL